LLAWAGRSGLQASNAADLVQEVFLILFQKINQYDPEKGRFRSWLRTICQRKWYDLNKKRSPGQAKEQDLAELADDGRLDQFWQEEHNAFLLRRALTIFQELREQFSPQSVDICMALLVEEMPVAQVARQFGVTENAVRLAKLKVLRR